MSVSPPLRFDSIQIVDSLQPGDHQTARLLLEDVEPIAGVSKPPVSCCLKRVNTRADLFAFLGQLSHDARRNRHSPILHIETHGNEDGIGLASGESVSWVDLKPALTALNEASRLNLLVMLSACEGAHLVSLLQPSDRAPVFALIGPKRVVTGRELELATAAFYRTLFRSKDAAAAWRAMNTALHPSEKTFAVFTAEFMLRYVFHHYLKNECTEDALESRFLRVERDLRLSGMPEAQIEAGRPKATQYQRDHRSHFAKVKNEFLLCDLYPENFVRFGVTFDDCLDLSGE